MAIDFALDQHVATITINRPERMNAMDPEHYNALSAAWVRVRDTRRSAWRSSPAPAKNPSRRARTSSRSSGAQPPLSELLLTQKNQILNRGLEVWKPIVAAVNGYCLGGGMTLLLATDLRIAAEHATFSVAEVKRGVFPANGGTQRIAQQLPHAIAMELLLLGDSIDAQTALRWGLVNRVVKPAELMATARDFAARLARNAPLAVQAAKELAVRSRDIDLRTGLRIEELFLRLLQGSEDVREGTAAFAEKRPPSFGGR